MITEEYATPPPQCPYKRASTWKEILFGWMWGFDHKYETQCMHYAGHLKFGYRHEDSTRTQWD